MNYLDIYLIGIVFAFCLTIFLLEVNSKDVEKYSFEAKVAFVILFSIFSWVYFIGMSVSIISYKLKK